MFGGYNTYNPSAHPSSQLEFTSWLSHPSSSSSFGTCTWAMLLNTLRCARLASPQNTARMVTPLLQKQKSDSVCKRPSWLLWPRKTSAYASPQALPLSLPQWSDSSARVRHSASVYICRRIRVEFPTFVDRLRTGRKSTLFRYRSWGIWSFVHLPFSKSFHLQELGEHFTLLLNQACPKMSRRLQSCNAHVLRWPRHIQMDQIELILALIALVGEWKLVLLP